MADAPLSFEDVSRVYRYAKGSEYEKFGKMSIPEFSRYMNQQLGTDRYRIGEKASGVGGVALEASAALDDLLAPISGQTKEAGGALGSLVGPVGREIGEGVGGSLPRMGVDLGLFLGGAAMGPAGIPLMGLGMGSAAAGTYGQTGSAPAAAISAATLPAFGPTAKVAGGQAVKYITPQIERFIGKNLPLVSERGVRELGEQAGIFGLSEASRQGQSLVQGQGFAPITPRSIGENLAANIPFLPLSVPRLAKGYRVGYEIQPKPGQTHPVIPANFKDFFQNRGPYFPRQSEAQAVAGRSVVPDVTRPAQEFHAISTQVEQERTVQKGRKVDIDNADAVEDAINEVYGPRPTGVAVKPSEVQPPLPGEVSGKTLAKIRQTVYDKKTAYDLRDRLKDFGSSIKFNEGTKGWDVEWDAPPPKAAFLPEQLMGKTFGLVSREQLSEQKPYGVARLPGDFLPGNTVLERMPKVLDKAEWDMLKDAGVEAFLKGRRVSVAEMNEWLDTNGPRVEIKPLEANVSLDNPNANRMAAIRHEMDTAGLNDFLDVDPVEWPAIEATLTPAQRAMAVEYHRLARIGGFQVSNDSATARYQQVNPKPLAEMKDAVDILVRVPVPPMGRTMQELADAAKRGPSDVKFQGQHFSASDQNVLGWARGYFETTPDGKKIFHVFEVQSDWGQQRRGAEERMTQEARQGREPRNGPADHPLLADYNRLALKAAIKHALEKGATHIAISDAETAMMTEGHDLHADYTRVKDFRPDSFQGRQDAAKWMEESPDTRRIQHKWDNIKNQMDELWGEEKRVSQEPGMRLNYDQILPKIAEELIGSKGERVSLGEHKNAGIKVPTADNTGPMDLRYDFNPRENLIFKNPDGTPKTNVTANVFPLAKVEKELLRRGGFTLTGKDKLVEHAKTLEADGSSVEAIARSVDTLSRTPRKPGESLADIAAREVGLPEVINADVPPGEFLLRTHQFFDRYFSLKGEVGGRKDFLIRNAMVMAAKFEKLAGRTRLAEVLQGPSFHAPAREGKLNALIGLRTTKVVQKRELENLRLLWDFGHEMSHEIEAQIVADPTLLKDSTIHQAYQKVIENSKELDATEKGFWVQGLVKHGMPEVAGEFDYKGEVYRQFRGSDPNAEASEFGADLLGIYSLSSANQEARNSLSDYAFLTSPDVQNLTGQMMKNLNQMVLGARDFFDQQMRGVGKPDERTVEARNTLNSIHDNLLTVMEGVHRGEVANDAFRAVTERAMTTAYDRPPVVSFKQVQAMYRMMGQPGVWIKRADSPEVKEALNEAQEEIMPVAGGKRLKPWERFYPAVQLAQSYPELKPIVDMVRDVIARVSRSTEEMWGHFHDGTGKIDEERLRKLGSSGPVRNAFDELLLFQNVEERSLTGQELRTFLRERGHTLTDEQMSMIDLSAQQVGKVYQEGAHTLIRANLETLNSKTTLVLQGHNRGLRPNDAARLGKQITDFVIHPPQALPEQIALIETQLKQVAGSEQAYAAAKAVAVAGLEGHNNLVGRLSNRPWFSSEVRPHTWMVAWKKDGQRNLQSFKTQEEAQKKLEALVKGGGTEYVKHFNKLDTTERWRGLQRDVIEAYKEADQRVYQAALKGLEGVGDAETLRMLKEEFEPGDGAYRIVTPPYMLERSLVGGREHLNMVEQAMNYVDAAAYGTAKRYAKQQLQILLNSPELRNNPALQNIMRDYVSTFLDPQGREFTKMKNFVFLNFMGFNLSTSLIELTQNFLSTVPVMIRGGATLGQAYKYITSGMAEVGKAHLHEKARSLKTHYFEDSEIRDVVDRAEHDRIVDRGVVQELYSLEDALAVSRRNILTGDGSKVSAKELASNSAYWLTKKARDFYGLSTIFNSRSALVAAYRFAKKVKKLDHEASYTFAKDVVNTGLFGGGRANRPTILNGWGKLQGVGGLMYALSGYTFNTLAMYARFAKESTKGDKSAQKALATMLTSQMLVGGVMGLPIVSGLIAVLEQLFPDVEIKKNLRGTFQKLGGDDEKMGHILADVGMSGMFNAALPVADVGSRFQLGNLLGVDPYHGFQWGNLGGPATGMLENIVKGTQKVASGDYWNAAEKIAPAGVRGLIRMLGEEGGFRDEKGRLIIDPTPAEQFVTAVGFRPKRLNQYYEQQQITKRSEEIEQRRRNGLFNDLASKLLEGDREAVRRGLIEEANRAREAGSLFDPREGLSRVVEIAQARAVPIDPSRTGLRSNVAARAGIAGMYSQAPRLPSELEMYFQRKQLERSVGIPGTGRVEPRSVREAQLVDRLMASSGMTYTQARLAVQKAFSRPTPSL